MGPTSKEHVCNVLGFLVDEATQTREVLLRVTRSLDKLDGYLARLDNESADMGKLNQRVTQLGRALRGIGVAVPE